MTETFPQHKNFLIKPLGLASVDPMSNLHILGLTGGIATGKSTAMKIIQDLYPSAVVFDADAHVKELYTSEILLTEIRESFGNQSVVNGALDRDFLRELIFKNPEAKKQLEALVHPKVRKDCLALLEKAQQNPTATLFIADVPLLFERGFDFGQQLNLVVAVSRETQILRLKQRNGFDDATVLAILEAQLPIDEKIIRGDIVFWNEGPPEMLERQLQRFFHNLLHMNEEISIDNMNEEFSASKEAKNTQSDVAKSPEDTPTEAVEKTEPVEPEKPKYDIPEAVDINEFRARSLAELYLILEALPVRIQANSTKAQLVFDIITFYGKEGCEITGTGVLEQAKENYGMLRDPIRSFKTSPDDLYLSGEFLKKYDLKPGHLVKVKIRAPRPRDKYLSASEVVTIEGINQEDFNAGKHFDKLTPLFPEERLILDNGEEGGKAVRIVDLVAPLGKGQRGLIVAPPRGGKTILLKQIAKSIVANHPESHLIIMLLDERPEEVTDFEDTVDADVFASTFDEVAKRHAQVADLVLERAKRLVEQKKDVVILLDSLTRLARGHNNAHAGGPIGSGGLNQNAMQKSRKFFGTARNVEEGGSLTILATALVETESKMDEVIFEEFKGTGNMEIRLDKDLAERRIFPAIHIPQSGTRNDDRLYHPDEMRKVIEIRRHLAALPVGEAVEVMLKQLAGTQNNAEFLMRGLR